MLDNLKNKIKIKPEYLIICLAITLVIIFTLFNSNNKSTENVNETEKYLTQIENKLKKSIEKIEGVKSATVSVTIKEGITTLIAEEVKEIEENGKKTKTTTPVLVSGKPIILGETYPEIAGVLIICNCSDSMTVKMSVLDVVTTMLDVSCDKVRILTQ